MARIPSEKSEFTKVLAKFTSSQILYNLLRMVSGLMVVKLTIPELYGTFTGVGIYLGYIVLGQLGLYNGLSRDLPFELGRKHHKYANLLASSGWVITVFVSVIVSVVFAAFGLKAYFDGDLNLAIICFVYVFIGFLHLATKFYLPSLYRTSKDFNVLSKLRIYSSIFSLFSVLFLLWEPLYGLCIRAASLMLFEFAFLYYFKPFKLEFKFSFSLISRLIRTGFPMFILGQIRFQWMTVINNIILILGGATYFGYYALSNIVTGTLGIVPTAFNQIIFPKMSIAYGENESHKSILYSSYKPTLLLIGLTLSLAIAGSFALPFVVDFFLPKYSEGIAAAQWSLFIPVVFSLSPALSYYNVIKKQRYYYYSTIIGVAFGSIFMYWRYFTDGFSLELFPQGIIIGTFVQMLLGLYLLKILVDRISKDPNQPKPE